MEQQPETFHLFGALWVSDPQTALHPDDQSSVNRGISLIRDFEKSQSSESDRNPWDMTSAHQQFVNDDVAWWRARNVERPANYVLRPSGSLDASVACLLFNPTFCVDDPDCRETFDTSNATIAQLERAGFNPKNTFFVDQIARRDLSPNVEEHYPEDLWDIHEGFLRKVWDNMQAVVVICWGSAVRKRLLGTANEPGWFQNYEMVRLWGRYGGIELFLELSADQKSMKRFVLFVKHPSHFFYIQGDGDGAKELRRTRGRPQDLALEVGAKIGQITLEPHFYELSPKLRVSLCVPRVITRKREGWKSEAAAQLQRAFPSAELCSHKSHQGARKRDPKAFDEFVLFLNQYSAGEVNVDGPLKKPDVPNKMTTMEMEDHAQKRRLSQIITSFWEALREVLELTKSSAASGKLDAENVELSLDSMNNMENLHEYEDLPAQMLELIQSQPGLMFGGRPIACRETLERAYDLLHPYILGHDVPNRPKMGAQRLEIANLAISVLIGYGIMISRYRRPVVDELLVLRDAPYDVLARICSACKQQVLDDPFPYWAKFRPEMYVSWSILGGCGNPGCECLRPTLKPLDQNVKWSRSERRVISEQSIHEDDARKAANPINWFLRTEAERGTLPVEIEVKCSFCPRKDLVRARWTIRDPATLVIPQLVCGSASGTGCGKKGDWTPVEQVPFTRSNTLSRLWSEFAKKGCLLSEHPRDGSVIFGEGTLAFRIAKLKELKRAQLSE